MPNSVRMLVVLLLGATLSGCPIAELIVGMHPEMVTFDESEYLPYAGAGTASVSGEAFVKGERGEIIKGAGEPVYLTPATSYSREWVKLQVIGQNSLTPYDPRMMSYTRTTKADDEGRFRFEKLPPGEYFLVCSIVWQVQTAGKNMVKLRSVAHEKVKVGTGEEINVVLTRP